MNSTHTPVQVHFCVSPEIKRLPWPKQLSSSSCRRPLVSLQLHIEPDPRSVLRVSPNSTRAARWAGSERSAGTSGGARPHWQAWFSWYQWPEWTIRRERWERALLYKSTLLLHCPLTMEKMELQACNSISQSSSFENFKAKVKFKMSADY